MSKKDKKDKAGKDQRKEKDKPKSPSLSESVKQREGKTIGKK
ncbi:hypothetical protein [Mucilaginibacter polytrichastri]|uniref:Uncharacterized protein n=1 Tax=Mucilaginibacter polytrichastri TaxID=1302689 RepID=A0A1Q5ZS14_9SPHI|nr:hypothetical protein [Mucilaginibacter polytrichastri]OKS84554.1 hypothetical protein RG47T_5244 [Mucilaginibacter polytrichastri]SFT23936.1 hypothetical protein SAMN04487890_12158 [Mucilaginibacter polytrichastri]